MTSIGPITQQSRIVDTVYDRLCDAIFHHEIVAGTRLSVPGLAAQFGVSRSPVKEAVQQLVTDGLAESVPRRGVFVAEFDLNDILNILDIRAPLEGIAGGQAASRISDGDILRLQKLLELQEKAAAKNDAVAYAKWDSEFHSIIAEVTGNERLCQILKILHNQMRLMSPLVFHKSENLQASVKEHQEIVDAIAARKPQDAEKALTAHTQNSKKRISMQFRELQDSDDTK